jgi:hypothetical protein
MPPQPPDSLPPRYKLWPSPEEAHLGAGGAASVWRVQDEALGVLVALKVLKKASNRMHARLEREAVLASRVVHPNVIALHDVGLTPDGRSYMAFPLASDGTMLDIAPRVPPWAELQALIVQLLQALAAMHARDILHLDVKLSNLLLHRTASGMRQLWLADLGVARALTGEDDDDKSVVGTVSYMASERLTGQHHLWCPATDLFAVGAVIFRLLTGRLPFPSKDPGEGMQQRMDPPKALPVRPWIGVPERLGEVVLPMLQFDPRSRYDLATDAIRAFQSLGPPKGGTGTPPPALASLLPTPTLEVTVRASANPAGRPHTRPANGVPVWYRPPVAAAPSKLDRGVRHRRVPQAPALMLHREIELVGRESEFELMWRAARTAMRTRRPLMVEIKGQKGVGRTRLVEDFTRTMEELGLGEGVRMVQGLASGPTTGLRGAWRRITPPGSPHNHFVREIATLLARDRAVRWEDCLQDATSLASWLDPQPDTRPTWNRSTIRGMLVEHLERRTWRGLSWLWIEDADLAGENEDCWPIIDQILARGAPILVLVTTRTDRITPSLMEIRARHHRSVRSVSLAPLPPDKTLQLVQAHLPLAPELSAEAARHGRGIPKAIRNLMAWWIRTGMLREESEPLQGRQWSLAPNAPAPPEDALDFARARVARITDPARIRALRLLSLSGPGTPETVFSAVAGEALDHLVVDGLVDLSRGGPSLDMPELAKATLEKLTDDKTRTALHMALAKAWSTEGDDPRVAASVGAHLFAAGQHADALGPLDAALRGLHQTLPVPEVRTLAEMTLAAATSSGAEGGRAWVHAAMVLADAAWRQGSEDRARTLDAALAQTELRPGARVQAACAAARRRGPTDPNLLSELEPLKGHMAEIVSHRRAELLTTLAQARSWALDPEGALADLHEAMASSPRPSTACRARLLRARLLSTTDPMVGWYEALRTVEVARDHGLLRYEVLAWGLVGESMVMLGRSQEAIERLRSGVARLLAHGETRASTEVRLHLGIVLRAAGRLPDAHKALLGAMDGRPPPFGTLSLGPRAQTAVLAALDSDPDTIWDYAPTGSTWPAADAAWALLLPLASLLEEELPEDSDLAIIERAPALGAEGLFLARALAELYRTNGRRDLAVQLERTLAAACQRLGIDLAEGDNLLERFRRSRR